MGLKDKLKNLVEQNNEEIDDSQSNDASMIFSYVIPQRMLKSHMRFAMLLSKMM